MCGIALSIQVSLSELLSGYLHGSNCCIKGSRGKERREMERATSKTYMAHNANHNFV